MNQNWPELIQQNIRPPESIAEAIDRLLSILDGEQKIALVVMQEDDLIDLHFGFGLAIRNAFGLHEPGNRLLASCGVAHPDDASMSIVRALWVKLI